jgi:hypothetical protein
MPPNSSHVASVVRAPNSAARRAAITPAGPAPITTTFIWRSSAWFTIGGRSEPGDYCLYGVADTNTTSPDGQADRAGKRNRHWAEFSAM